MKKLSNTEAELKKSVAYISRKEKIIEYSDLLKWLFVYERTYEEKIDKFVFLLSFSAVKEFYFWENYSNNQ